MKRKTILIIVVTAALMPLYAVSKDSQSGGHDTVSNEVIAQQRQNLAQNTEGQGFGPQAPRDIGSTSGTNDITFNTAPAYSQMNLCNIHFHKNAEHKGGGFTKYAGNGDGQGYLSGYQYSGHLTEAELSPLDHEVCPSEHSSLFPGDTIEVHYVFSSAQVTPGPTLGSCFNNSIKNPQLRVEAQVCVLVNDTNAADFMELIKHGKRDGLYQALHIPSDTGTPVQYAGSTTGPAYNQKGSPYQVTWGVRPEVIKANIESVGKWCKGNIFKEDHPHGVRNLVMNPDLLSKIKQ